MSAEIRHISNSADFAAVFDVSRETLDRLAIYEALLRQWQKAVNLVAPSTLDAVWHRHFADSAQIVRRAPQARSKMSRTRSRSRNVYIMGVKKAPASEAKVPMATQWLANR